MNRNKAQRAYLKYLAPTMLVIFLLTLIPIAVTVVLSLTSLSYRSAKPSEFVGIQNYVRLFSDDRFLNSIPTSIILIVVPVAAQLILGFIVAIVMHEKLPWMGWLRIIFVAPMVLPPIVMGLMWHTIYPAVGRRQLLSEPDRCGGSGVIQPTFALLR